MGGNTLSPLDSCSRIKIIVRRAAVLARQETDLTLVNGPRHLAVLDCGRARLWVCASFYPVCVTCKQVSILACASLLACLRYRYVHKTLSSPKSRRFVSTFETVFHVHSHHCGAVTVCTLDAHTHRGAPVSLVSILNPWP